MAEHELKILPKYFDAVNIGAKNFEIRKNDRNFCPHDKLVLKEWDGQRYTGRELHKRVSYVYYGDGKIGLADGYCVMGLSDDRWIPVSERLPNVGEDILFCDNECSTEEGCLRADGDWWQFRWSTVRKKEDVTAWMPLPEPYKDGEQDG